jgi:hypothetical protein
VQQSHRQAAPPAGDPQRATVRLLWTGGWDSTFQLLRLLLVHGKHVTPYYLMRERRPSTPVEVATMARIRSALNDRFPATRTLLHPTRFFDVARIAPDPAITDAYEHALQQRHLGRQYEWLAWFCVEQRIDEIELCIHRDDKAHAVLDPFVIEADEGAGYRTHRFDARHRGRREDAAELHRLFRHFSFPLFETTKLEMASEAQSRGWQPIMDMTWFCHSPLRGKPCGICNPCLYTIEEGLGHRLPRWSRIRAAVFRNVLLPFKAPIVATLRLLGLRRADE